MTPLLVAAGAGHADAARALARAGADTTVVDGALVPVRGGRGRVSAHHPFAGSARNVLHLACARGHLEVAQWAVADAGEPTGCCMCMCCSDRGGAPQRAAAEACTYTPSTATA